MNHETDTIVVHMPRVSIGTLKALANDIACDVHPLPDGGYLFRERHGNTGVVPMQRYRHQIARVNSRNLPQPPSGGEAA